MANLRFEAVSEAFKKNVGIFELTGDVKYLEALREEMLANDYLAKGETGADLLSCYKKAKDILKYRNIDNAEGSDGLDGVRHNLRLLRQENLKPCSLLHRDLRMIRC